MAIESASALESQTATPSNIELANIESSKKQNDVDPYLVTFREPFDEDNPKDWSNGKKWTVTDVLSATSFTRIMMSTIMAPALPIIAKELHMSGTESVMALSSYMLATAFGPLVLRPLSELYGRSRIMHASNVWFLVWTLVCGFAHTKGLLIAARFIAGFGASAIYSLAGGVLGDIWRPEQRGRSLGIYALIPVLGGAVGPIIGAVMAGRANWRWMFWSTSAFQGLMILASFLAFQETYGPLILRRRAEKIREETGDQRYCTAEERLSADQSFWNILSKGLSRPIRLLVFNHIIQIMAGLSGFMYGALYIILSTLSSLYVKAYHEDVQISGLHYLAPSLGEIIRSQVGGVMMDRLSKKLKNREGGEFRPEFHIPLMLPTTIIACAGFIMYGWCAQSQTFWFAVDVGVFLAAFGMQVAGQNIQGYVIDSFPEHTGSATAASQFIRSLTAFA